MSSSILHTYVHKHIRFSTHFLQLANHSVVPYTHIRTYCTHYCKYTHMHTYTCTHIQTYTYKTHTRVHIHTHICTYTYIHMYTRTHTHTHMHILIHTYVRTHIHIIHTLNSFQTGRSLDTSYRHTTRPLSHRVIGHSTKVCTYRCLPCTDTPDTVCVRPCVRVCAVFSPSDGVVSLEYNAGLDSVEACSIALNLMPLVLKQYDSLKKGIVDR